MAEISKRIERIEFIPFPCLREYFTEKSVATNTFPDPLKANLTAAQTSRARAPKSKAPKQRAEPVIERAKLGVETYSIRVGLRCH